MDSDANTYLVLGATGGIGSELCRRLARDGANPVLAARDEGRLGDLARELDAPYHAVDATEGKAVVRLTETWCANSSSEVMWAGLSRKDPTQLTAPAMGP